MVKHLFSSRRVAWIGLLLVALSLALCACGGTSAGSAKPTPAHPTATALAHQTLTSLTIALEETNGQFTLSPKTVTIKPGQSVTWKNETTSPQSITGQGFPSSPSIPPGGTYRYTFEHAGHYTFVNSAHPTETGTVVVS
jgi:plastocyanin